MKGFVRRRGARRPRRAGFTLLEVMIAMTVLAVGLLALAALQLHAMRGGAQGRHSTRAAAVARDQMEAFQRMAWVGMGPTAGWLAGPNVTTTVQGPGGPRVEETYGLDWRITDVVPGFTRAVDVRVTWTEDDSGNAKRLLLSSIRYNW